jgi:hypothetical protein
MIECIIAWFGGANAPQNYDCASLGVNSWYDGAFMDDENH